MPFRPNQYTVLAPGYAPSVQGPSSHHHDVGSAPPPVDSHPQDDYQQPLDGAGQSLGIEGQAAAATLISLHQPSSTAPGPSQSHLPDGHFTDEADASYTEGDSSSEGYLDQSMTDSDGGAGIGGSASWGALPQAVPVEPSLLEGNGSFGIPPVVLADLQSAGLFFQMHGSVFGQQPGGMTPFAEPLGPQGQFPWTTTQLNNAETTVNPATMAQNALEAQDQIDEENDTDPPLPPPVPQSNPFFGPLGPDNPGVLDFLTYWARLGDFSPNLRSAGSRVPSVHEVTREANQRRSAVRFDELLGDERDFQGLDWKQMGITRKAARERRLLIYRNYVNAPGSDKWRVSSRPYERYQRLWLTHVDSRRCLISPYQTLRATLDSRAWTSDRTSISLTSSSAICSGALARATRSILAKSLFII